MLVYHVMNPRNEGDPRQKTDTDSQFIAQIPDLVRRSIGKADSKTRRAQRELVKGATDSPFYDPTFIAFEHFQRALPQQTSPRDLRETLGFFSNFLITANEDTIKKNGKKLRATPQTITAARRIVQNDAAIQKDKYLRTFIESAINNSYQGALQMSRDLSYPDKKPEDILIVFNSPSATAKEKQERNEEVNRQNYWIRFLRERESNSFDREQIHLIPDRFVEKLKEEPQTSQGRIFTRRASGLSIQDIETIQYPLSSETLDQMTHYLADISSSTLSDVDKRVTQLFLMGYVLFRDNEKYIDYKNRNILSNIAQWQQRFVLDLLYADNPEKEAAIKNILENIAPDAAVMLLSNIQQHAAYPYDHDPEYKEGYVFDTFRYPLSAYAMDAYSLLHPDATQVYSDEVGMEYFANTAIPLLEKRISDWKLKNNVFEEIIPILKNDLEDFSQIHMEALKGHFMSHCGEEFLQKLTQHSGEIEEVTKRVWETSDMHFLPMQQGLNIITFSNESVPDILGLESISLHSTGSLENWRIAVSFKLKDTLIGIMGELDQDGILHLKAPVDREIPGLYTILKHIAILTFHDLTIQEKKNREQKESQNPSSKKPRENDTSNKRNGGSLPRIQKDSDLIRDVYTQTGYTPRRVELHKGLLRGAKQYREMVELYNQVIAEGSPEDVQAASELLSEARKKSYQASEKKQANVPARFSLETVTDPETGKERAIETWFVEHTSPKPTEEELKSPVKIFERYYKNSSALASLDQMKPWFVGQ